MVNSKSCTSLKCFSSVWRIRSSSLIRLRQLLLQLGDRLRRPDAGDDVLALRVDQELAVELLDAVRRIARERDARSRLIAGVAVHHRLHVDGRAPLRRDVVLAAVDDRAIVHPGAEHGADGAHQLIPRRRREVLAGALLDERLEAARRAPSGPRASASCLRCPCDSARASASRSPSRTARGLHPAASARRGRRRRTSARSGDSSPTRSAGCRSSSRAPRPSDR